MWIEIIAKVYLLQIENNCLVILAQKNHDGLTGLPAIEIEIDEAEVCQMTSPCLAKMVGLKIKTELSFHLENDQCPVFCQSAPRISKYDS